MMSDRHIDFYSEESTRKTDKSSLQDKEESSIGFNESALDEV